MSQEKIVEIATHKIDYLVIKDNEIIDFVSEHHFHVDELEILEKTFKEKYGDEIKLVKMNKSFLKSTIVGVAIVQHNK